SGTISFDIREGRSRTAADRHPPLLSRFRKTRPRPCYLPVVPSALRAPGATHRVDWKGRHVRELPPPPPGPGDALAEQRLPAAVPCSFSTATPEHCGHHHARRQRRRHCRADRGED